MDGVIVDFISPIVHYLGVQMDDITTYWLPDLFPDRKADILKFCQKKNYFKGLRPYPKALDFVKKVGQLDGVKAWFVSKPIKTVPETWADKIHWVTEHTPKMLGTTILSPDKSVISVDMLIDDDPKNLLTSPAKHKILFSRPWNHEDILFDRVKNYDELLDKIKNILKKEKK
jgi:5'(3')-deoxyribonucleotidase